MLRLMSLAGAIIDPEVGLSLCVISGHVDHYKLVKCLSAEYLQAAVTYLVTGRRFLAQGLRAWGLDAKAMVLGCEAKAVCLKAKAKTYQLYKSK